MRAGNIIVTGPMTAAVVRRMLFIHSGCRRREGSVPPGNLIGTRANDFQGREPLC
jgi:hypothetical protein